MYVAPTVSPSSLIAGSCMGCGSGAVAIAGLPGGGSGGTAGTYGGAGGTGAPGSAGAAGTGLGSAGIEPGQKDLPEAKGAAASAAGIAGTVLNEAVKPGSDWFWVLIALAAIAGATTRKRRRR